MTQFVVPRPFRVAGFRFAALYVVVFVTSALVLGITVFLQARSALQQQIDARVEVESMYLDGEYDEHGLADLVALVQRRGHGAGALTYLVQQGDRRLAGTLPPVTGGTPGWRIVKISPADHEAEHPRAAHVMIRDLGNGVLLGVGSSLLQVHDLEEAITNAFVWTVGLAAVLGIVGGALLSRAFLHRVDTIARTAEAIIGGDLARRVPTRGTGDDLDRLAATLNRMLDRIATLMESLRQVSSDVAHDLRTPLTRLYHRLEDARTRAGSVAEYQDAVDGAITEAQGLLETFSALLQIAQVEGATPRADLAPVLLSTVAEAVVDAYRLDVEEGGHVLTASIAPDVWVRGNRELLTQALANLVENALRHTPPGTQITVQLEEHDSAGVILTVKDNGPGVPEVELPRLTNRFYRAERSRTTPGNGLGLTLVSAVADLHGAALRLGSADPGLQISLTFPPVERPAAPGVTKGSQAR